MNELKQNADIKKATLQGQKKAPPREQMNHASTCMSWEKEKKIQMRTAYREGETEKNGSVACSAPHSNSHSVSRGLEQGVGSNVEHTSPVGSQLSRSLFSVDSISNRRHELRRREQKGDELRAGFKDAGRDELWTRDGEGNREVSSCRNADEIPLETGAGQQKQPRPASMSWVLVVGIPVRDLTWKLATWTS